MLELIKYAIEKGAILVGSVSGGKDGQAMVKTLVNNKFPVTLLIHADLGRVEWPDSIKMCKRQSEELNIPLITVTRHDGLDLLAYWQRRMYKLMSKGKPFWSSAKQRYCTSDLKREPINKYFRSLPSNFIISCEGIRAEESSARAKKSPLSIRKEITSTYYDGMSVIEAIANFNPKKRLALTWYPVFNYTLEDVWLTYGMTMTDAEMARHAYACDKKVPEWWPFHPAYAFGNDRVSCIFCVLGSINDLKVGAKHNPDLLDEMIHMEDVSDATFRHNWSLRNLKEPEKPKTEKGPFMQAIFE
jgi:3'-phosphoadenosine 5'-phosphosulfate sulfotransferase (PAPS reductase)/FAD synthetase